jgi:hypothetical protein
MYLRASTSPAPGVSFTRFHVERNGVAKSRTGQHRQPTGVGDMGAAVVTGGKVSLVYYCYFGNRFMGFHVHLFVWYGIWGGGGQMASVCVLLTYLLYHSTGGECRTSYDSLVSRGESVSQLWGKLG